MHLLQRRRSTHLVIGFVLLAALALPLATPATVSAGFKGCRADPIVTFADGRVIQLALVLETEPGHVHAITHTIHAPRGAVVQHIALTGGPLKAKEKVEVVADLPPDQYTTDTVVTTGPHAVMVEARGRVGRQFKSITGRSGEHLSLAFTVSDKRGS